MNYLNDVLNGIELPLLKQFHALIQCDFLDTILPFISNLCKWGAIWIILGILMLFFKKTRRIGITMIISLIIGLVVCNFTLKPLTMRLRPYIVDPSINLLLAPEKEYSFPSGHTIASFEGAMSIFFYNKSWGSFALLLAFVIAFSRLYLMMHYFSDVFVSIILGSVFAYFAYLITKLIFLRKDRLEKI